MSGDLSKSEPCWERRKDARPAAESTRAQVASDQADLTWALAEFERYRGLREKNFVAATVLDQKQQALDAAQARLHQTQARLSVAQNQSAYSALVAETDGVMTAVNLEPGQVVSAGQSVMRIARHNEREVSINLPESRIDELRNSRALQIALWSDPNTPDGSVNWRRVPMQRPVPSLPRSRSSAPTNRSNPA